MVEECEDSLTTHRGGYRCEFCEPTFAKPDCHSYPGKMSKTFVGVRLRQLRTERGLSQASLAKTLEISASYLNQIEHDVRPLTVPVLLRISEVFGVDTTFFSPAGRHAPDRGNA